ncbi:heme lyase CcmF/NrfE family subunit [Marinicauda algicola]|uniref:Heme lyase CcmF/NrfE family subunit n=1 Tax=Marinicauda algicola TaxID=2029849 RepID=A0A4S2H3N4_9PROT|nr:heme lyase CcmF/NrfE family subunit [Marinicauda algicola]TGY89971.1 heme lyase CcmF/NrfE family subunit [Marinicauda algicola]
MIAELGRFLIALALTATLAQIVFAWLGANRGGQGGLARAGEAAVRIAVFAAASAFLLLIVSFLRSDFSIAYVAGHSHVDKPLVYKIAAAWGGHEGSMLLWCLLLALFGFAISRIGPVDDALRLRAVSVQGMLQLLFFGFLAFASNPFDRAIPAPIQGADLNPILQDPALAMHPPLLYVGYVGLSSAFAIAAAGLVQRTGGRVLASALRPWALGAWTSLTAGIALGAWWAYYELGWGGWWFWDPVENASFMPWLLGAALIHSVIATEKRGAFPGWTVFLALLAFILSTLGAFLVRSGVLTSVHAFALDPERGVWILGMLALSAVGGFTLFALRAGSLGEGEGFEPTSREAFIGANNLLLAASAGVVLVGTIYPLIMEMAGGATVSVGAPYFNAAATPLMMAALVLLPLAPFLPWANGGAKPGLKQMRAAFLLLPMAIAGAVFLWFGAPVMAVIGGVVGVWVITGAAMDALSALPAAKTRALRWSASGRALAHAGAGFIALGAAADASRPPELTRALVPGETISHAGHTLTLESVRRADGPNYLADRAVLRLEEGGTVRPERRFYPAADQNTREVDIRSRPGGDLYVAIGEPRPQPGGETGYEIRIAFHPLIWSLGLGALLIVAGGGLALAGRIAGPVMQRRRKAGETAAREVPA